MKRTLEDASQEIRLPPPRDLLGLSSSIPQYWPPGQDWDISIDTNLNSNGASNWSLVPPYDNETPYLSPAAQGTSFEPYQAPFDWNQILLGPDEDMMNPLFDSSNSQNTPNSNVLPNLHCTDPSQSPTQTPQSSIFVTDDVPIVFDHDVVCFGEIRDIDMKLIGEMEEIRPRLNHCRLMVKIQPRHMVVCCADGFQIGHLRPVTANTLEPLEKRSDIELEPLVTASLRETVERATTNAEAVAKIDINVYGSSSISASIGKDLSNGKLWLQRPRQCRPSTEYKNPHHLNLKNVNASNLIRRDLNLVNKKNGDHPSKGEERLQKLIESLYQSMDTDRHQYKVDAGDRVSRKLLTHQQQALGFMLARETGRMNEEDSLWQKEGSMDRYRHKITKEIRSSKPVERGGGILADEMGLGKSLSILSLAMQTLDTARAWAEEKSGQKDHKLKFSRSTLVVVPSALLIHNWQNEIEMHLKKGAALDVKYHGSTRKRNLEFLCDSDIVITTYDTLYSDFKNSKLIPSVLHNIHWYRVVLDEAHFIRHQNTKFFKSCIKLHANSRWCLTGTPIQNKMADLASLFAFIQADEFAQRHNFRRYVEQPMDHYTSLDRDQIFETVRNRLVLLLRAFCLRRSKATVGLPEPVERLRELDFTPAERRQYETTKSRLQRQIKQNADAGDDRNGSELKTFHACLELRILSNLGTFQREFDEARWQLKHDVASAEAPAGQVLCFHCHRPLPYFGSSRLDSTFVEKCKHAMCVDCLDILAPSTSRQKRHCPICKPARAIRQEWPPDNIYFTSETIAIDPDLNAIHDSRDTTDSPGDSDLSIGDNSDDMTDAQDANDGHRSFNPDGYSTKMTAVLQDVNNGVMESKSIIFSLWTRTLDLLAKHLNMSNICHIRIDGSCPPLERQRRLDQFSTDESTRVLIMTTGTGAFGLNLTCANRVFIVEPEWNPAVEIQAIARAIRLGQDKDKDVEVFRYIIKDTVEVPIRDQQASKKRLAGMGFVKQAVLGVEENAGH